jgi:thiol-disulfide isomerase/thioredoxin
MGGGSLAAASHPEETAMSRRRIHIAGLISLLALLGMTFTTVMAWSSSNGDSGDVGDAGSASANNSAELNPALDFAVDLYQGDNHSEEPIWRLSNHQGNTVLVNLWAVSCPPCRAEMPSLERTYIRFKARGFIVVGVDVERGDPVKVRRMSLEFLRELGITFPAGPPLSDQILANYQVTGIPTSILVKPDGNIHSRWGGVLEEDNVNALAEDALGSY